MSASGQYLSSEAVIGLEFSKELGTFQAEREGKEHGKEPGQVSRAQAGGASISHTET